MKERPPSLRNMGNPRVAYVLRGEIEGRTVVYPLHPGRNTLGRGDSCDILVPDRSVSRRHAAVLWQGDELRVEDLGSHNGTLVNGCLVTQALLKPGDVLSFGAIRFVLAVAPSDDVEPMKLSVPSSGAEHESSVEIKAKVHSTAGNSSVPARVVGRNATPSRDASTTGDGRVPAQWLDVFGALVNGGAKTSAALGELLPLLVARLGVTAALRVEVRPRTGIVVQDCAGACEVGSILPRLQGLLVPGQAVSHTWTTSLFDQDPPLTVGLQWEGKTHGSGLVLVGDFAGREAVAVLFERLFPLFTDTPADKGEPQPAPCYPKLVFPPGHVVGNSVAMKALYRELQYLIRGNLPLLITGETGVGKEHIARVVHASSDRAAKPFVAVNCPGTNAELFEAELFGVEDRVATGVAKRDGKLKLANGGVALLDEVGELPPTLQAKLLRTLQGGEIYPVGAAYPVKIDVRIIAATNADLPELVEQGRFRLDLYHRLAGVIIRVPPLRERREDIPALAVAFMNRFAQELGARVSGLTERALRMLQEAPWPGNVRELEHVIKRAVLLCPTGQPITSELLALDPAPRVTAGKGESGDELNLSRLYARLERELIERALVRARGKMTHAAALLGISRQALRKKINALGIRYEP